MIHLGQCHKKQTGDPWWSKVSVLLPLSGADESTTFTDVSNNGFSFTASGNAKVDDGVTLFGENTLLLDGTGDYLSKATETAFDFGTGAFTIEAFVYFVGMPTSDAWPTAWNSHMVVVSHGVPGSASGYGLVIGATKIMFNNNDPQIASATHGMSTGAWYHVACTRDTSNVVRTFVEGVKKGESTGITTNYTYAYPLWIGAETGEGAYFNGRIAQVRITKGVARYTTDFDPPSAAFPTS